MTPTIAQVIVYGAVVAAAIGILLARLQRNRLLRDMLADKVAEVAALEVEEIGRHEARARGYREMYSVGRTTVWRDPLAETADPGSHAPPADGHDALRDFQAAWLRPNEDFIRETDRILNDIEWERLTQRHQQPQQLAAINHVDPDEVAPAMRLR